MSLVKTPRARGLQDEVGLRKEGFFLSLRDSYPSMCQGPVSDHDRTASFHRNSACFTQWAGFSQHPVDASVSGEVPFRGGAGGVGGALRSLLRAGGGVFAL